MDISLDALISHVEESATQPLAQLSEAATTAQSLGEIGDSLMTHFVDRCRRSGATWQEIGEHLGVTRQAVQKRYADEPSERPASRHRREHHGKYRPLWSWLSAQDREEVTMTFDEIETVLGFGLPPSSRRHQPHWHSYDGSAVVRAIVDAGWKAHNVDIAAERVTFARQ